MRIQDNILASLNPAVVCPLLDGRLVTFTMTAGVVNYVPHGLDRPYQGYFVVRNSVASDLSESNTTADNALKDTYVPLNTATNGTFTFWVF